jgi:nucleoside-diphosphate-sugar epimerase
MSDFAGKRVLITGATGFIGGALARRLSEEGAVVHGVTRRKPESTGPCERWWEADLTDSAAVRTILDEESPDLVFHLAGMVDGGRRVELVLPMLQANLVAPVNLLLAAQERGVRLLLAGSLEESQPDASWPIPGSPYAAAKLAAGAYARMFQALYGSRGVWLRLFMVYGPGQRDVRKLVPYVTLALLRGAAPMLSSGARPVDWIYIDDVVDAFLAAARTPELGVQPLDIGSGRLVTVRAVVNELVRLIDPRIAPGFGAVANRPLEQVCAADVAATTARLNWAPRTPLELGLRKTVEWYRRYSPPLGKAHPA